VKKLQAYFSMSASSDYLKNVEIVCCYCN